MHAEEEIRKTLDVLGNLSRLATREYSTSIFINYLLNTQLKLKQQARHTFTVPRRLTLSP